MNDLITLLCLLRGRHHHITITTIIHVCVVYANEVELLVAACACNLCFVLLPIKFMVLMNQFFLLEIPARNSHQSRNYHFY